MAIFLALVGAILAGVCITLSLSTSSRLRSFLGNPLAATSINFAGGALLLLILFGMGTIKFPVLSQLPTQPWWMFLGGLAGGTSVACNLVAISQMGLATSLLATIVGQLSMSVAIDGFGWLGVASKPISGTRILGIVVLLIAVVLTQINTSRPIFGNDSQ